MTERVITIRITAKNKDRLNEEQAVGALCSGLKEARLLDEVDKIKADSSVTLDRPSLMNEHPDLFEGIEDGLGTGRRRAA